MEDPIPPRIDPTPDVMNDPQFATNTADGEDGLDIDTCRICRGEGDDSEPLFHPCKCNGSIKYVHQDCLMEWLSHSQKKHCELCKTPFRFTKLYSPNMPPTLPLHLLLRHVMVHAVKNTATWLRAGLVIVVWLGFLPFAIRHFWGFLFWFSDGGWSSSYVSTNATNETSAQALELAHEIQQLTNDGISPATPLYTSSPTSPAKLGGMLSRILQYVGSGILNQSDVWSNSVLGYTSYDNHVKEVGISSNLTDIHPSTQDPTLLSEVRFLQNLTRYSAVNSLVITVTEGYVITILVVICFVLVFLIREWVVQQQPGINMGNGFNAEFADRARDQPAEPVLVGQRDIGQRPIARARRRNPHLADLDGGPHPPPQAAVEQAHDTDQQIDANGLVGQGRPSPIRDALSPAAEIQRRLTEEPRMTEEFMTMWRRADGDPEEVLRIIEREDKGNEMRYWIKSMKALHTQAREGTQGNNDDTPETLPLEALPENRRDFEAPSSSFDTSSISDSFPPHARDSDNSNQNNPSAPEHQHSEIIPGGRRDFLFPGPSFDTSSLHAHTGDSDNSSFGSDQWIDVSNPANLFSPSQTNVTFEGSSGTHDGKISKSSDKGKGKAVDVEKQFSDGDLEVNDTLATLSDRSGNIPLMSGPPTFSPSSGSRPRATSDGPQPTQTMSPLANNSWTFTALPTDRSSTPEPLHERETEDSTNQSKRVSFQIPQSATSSPGPMKTEAWKAAQDARVQQAVLKGIGAHNADIHSSINTSAESSDNEDGPIEIQGLDGTARIVQNWDEEFDNNPLSDSESDSETHNNRPHVAEPNPFAEDTPLPGAREPIVVRPLEPRGFLGNIAEFLWGGVGNDGQRDQPGANDEHIVQDLADEAPFIPVPRREAVDADMADEPQDRDVVEAAIAAGIDPNDPDAIDDAEDFEGIMELVGMRGQIFHLFQNALFSIFLLALTVAFGVWIPYNFGRLVLLLIANPISALKLPLRLLFGVAARLQDLFVSIVGLAVWVVLHFSVWLLSCSSHLPTLVVSNLNRIAQFSSTGLQLSREALDRIIDSTLYHVVNITDSELFAFSAASHEALINLRSLSVHSVTWSASMLAYPFIGNYSIAPTHFMAISSRSLQNVTSLIKEIPSVLARPESWVISLEASPRSTPLDPKLSVWGGTDRFWAIMAGYTSLCVLGALYVSKGTPFSTRRNGREWEAAIIDLLNQAGGVMKVILIISIEMLVFPLYCGLLLDAALLPLFDNATIMSRVQFTIRSPLTSIFVHWFVGTCYMFHFALFVAMCRKIMRKGVLYFIRDPDDPTFHPVRDVLERNVATQLKKILFSALVYGALVVICLGGVVWGLSFAFRGVLPIHWSSNEPVLEFPIDLLFYNFVMPLAIKFFRPSDGLHAMYSWWFRRCARMLRLTWFMFDERKKDEEGHHIRRTWGDVLRGVKGNPEEMVEFDDSTTPFEDPEVKAYFRHNGRYVRAPASDQVRIPKETSTFLPVDSDNNRMDGEPDVADGVHGRANTLYKHLYLPPWFRSRICLFILSIWIFAALTGVGITVIPLVFGRYVFAKVIPPHVRMNDVYAFSIGVYVLGSALYAALHLRQIITYLRIYMTINVETPYNVLRRANSIASLIGRIVWTYTALLFVLPTLFAFLGEFYLIIPLHTYLAVDEPHVVRFVQSWTLGLLYVKLSTRLILWYSDSRPAQSLRAIIRNGYLNPDAKLATRSFILPVGLAVSLALLWPWALAKLATMTFLNDKPEIHMLAYRYAYPMSLALCCIGFALYLMLGLFRDWRMMIRDEVYLIGERLHNFGDRRIPVINTPNLKRIDTGT